MRCLICDTTAKYVSLRLVREAEGFEYFSQPLVLCSYHAALRESRSEEPVKNVPIQDHFGGEAEIRRAMQEANEQHFWCGVE